MANPDILKFPAGVGERKGCKSPVGRASFPKLLQPDAKFGKPKFSVGLIFDPSDPAYQALKVELLKAHAEAVEYCRTHAPKSYDTEGKQKPLLVADPPFGVQLNRDKVPTGKMVVKFKANAEYTDKTKVVHKKDLPLYTGQAKPWPRSVEIGGGSRIRVYYDVVPFYTAQAGAGISLRMSAVTILEACTYGPKIDAEDDYVAPDVDVTPEGVAAEAPAGDVGSAPTAAGSF